MENQLRPNYREVERGENSFTRRVAPEIILSIFPGGEKSSIRHSNSDLIEGKRSAKLFIPGSECIFLVQPHSFSLPHFKGNLSLERIQIGLFLMNGELKRNGAAVMHLTWSISEMKSINSLLHGAERFF